MIAAAEVAEFIRQNSEAGELLSSVAIEAKIEGQNVPIADPSTRGALLIQEVISSHEDIRVILDDSGAAWYFSERFMTGSYARILLLKAQGPAKMMAEMIREHSRLYPRPVPFALFQCSPFNLSDGEIVSNLKEMAGKGPYRDIALLTTSIGNLFAYSTDHLEPGYAATLAEWVDVGQVQNP